MRKSFGGKVVLEISYAQKSGPLSLPQAGNYAIWVKGPLFRKTPLDQFAPEIYDEKTRGIVPLYRPSTRLTSNNGSTGRQRLFTFFAPAGNYTLQLLHGSSLNGFNSTLARIIPGKEPDLTKFFLQIKESKPAYYLLLGILLTLVSAGCIIGGLVLGVNGL